MNQPEKQPEAMSEFEKALSQSLRPVDPPAGFADSILARTRPAVPAKTNVVVMPRPRRWLGGAIAAALLTGAFTAEQIHLHQRRLESERAQKQFETALQITDASLEHARQQLQEAGVQIGN